MPRSRTTAGATFSAGPASSTFSSRGATGIRGHPRIQANAAASPIAATPPISNTVSFACMLFELHSSHHTHEQPSRTALFGVRVAWIVVSANRYSAARAFRLGAYDVQTQRFRTERSYEPAACAGIPPIGLPQNSHRCALLDSRYRDTRNKLPWRNYDEYRKASETNHGANRPG